MYKMPYSGVKGEVSVAVRGCLFSCGAWRAMARRLEFGNNVLAAGVPGEPGTPGSRGCSLPARPSTLDFAFV